jgi:ferredoxin
VFSIVSFNMMDKPRDIYHVTLKPSGNRIEIVPGTLLSDAIEETGLEPNLPCGGQGRCGRCKVVVEEVDERDAKPLQELAKRQVVGRAQMIDLTTRSSTPMPIWGCEATDE